MDGRYNKNGYLSMRSDSTLDGIRELGDLQLDVTQELARISTLQQSSHASIP